MAKRIARICTAGSAAVLLGCSSLDESQPAWRDGWRKAIVTELGRADTIFRSANRDCRHEMRTEMTVQRSFARAVYRPNDTQQPRRSIIVPAPRDAGLRPGDTIYVNVGNCAAQAFDRALAR